MLGRPTFKPKHLALLALLSTALLYARALSFDFILDDFTLILLNPALDSWRHWQFAFTQHVWAAIEPPVEPRHYRPFFALWLLLNRQLFGGLAPYWHLSSLALHVGVTALVYRLAARLSRNDWTAALAALLFAVHPAHIEPVVWISAASDLLATAFVILAFLFYLRGVEEEDSGPSFRSLLASSVCFACALLSKETAIIFPVLLLFYEGSFAPRRRLWHVVPSLAVVALFLLARRLAMSATNIAFHPDAGAIAAFPLVACGYAKVLLAPFSLEFFYAPSRWSWLALAEVLALGMILVAAAQFVRADRPARVALLWLGIFMVIPLASIAVFTPDNWVHDRHTYLPSAGLCIAAAMGMMRLRSGVRRMVCITVLAGLGVALALQLPRFQDELSLYRHALRRAPDNLELRLAYAYALNMNGRQEESRIAYRAITQDFPHSPEAFANLGMFADERGDLQEAADQLSGALARARPGSNLRILMLFRLGSVEARLGRLDRAEALLREAIALDDFGWNFHATLAQVLRKKGREAEAAAEMQNEEAARRAIIARRTSSP